MYQGIMTSTYDCSLGAGDTIQPITCSLSRVSKYGTYIQWNITQPQKEKKLGHLYVNGPGDCHIEWSKTKREKRISYINTYMWNLDKWYRWPYLQSKHRDTDIEGKCMDTKQGEGGWTGRLGLTYIHYWYYVQNRQLMRTYYMVQGTLWCS